MEIITRFIQFIRLFCSIYHRYQLYLAVMFFITACSKEVPLADIERETFYTTYPSDIDQYCGYIAPTTDEGYLMIGAAYSKEGFLKKIDKNGQLIWAKNNISDSVFFPLYTKLADGSVLMNSNTIAGNITKISKDGEVEFNVKYFNGFVNGAIGYPIVSDDGYILIPVSNGLSSGSPSVNRIAALNLDGSIYGYANFNDTTFGPNIKMLYWNIYKCPQIGIYYTYGWCFKNWNSSWETNRKLFVSKQVWDGNNLFSVKTVVIDSLNEMNENNDLYSCYTKENKLLMLSSQKDKNNVSKLLIIKVNDDLEIEWQKYLNIENAGLYGYNIQECEDGDYLITGACKVTDKINDQPFACKMDRYGHVVWSKIYRMAMTGALSCGVQNPDGTFILAGGSNAFGKGASPVNVLIIKTDAMGNSK